MRLKFVGLLAAAAASFASPAFAQSDATAAADNPLANLRNDLPPAIRYLQAQGVKLTFLGEEGGMRGYLGESPTGRMQTFYVAPDGNHVVAGLLFRNGGINVTGVQIGEMQSRFEAALEKNGSASPAAASPSAAASTAEQAAAASANLLSGAEGQSNTAVETTAASAAEKWRSDRDQAAFEARVGEAAWFTVGVQEAPVLYMVADPQCPYCHRAWESLRPLVLTKKIQLRVIMIAGLQGSEPLVRSILAMPEPGKAWLDGQGSARDVEVQPLAEPGSAEWEAGGVHMASNQSFARDLDIRGTPFLIYVGKDGGVYESSGLPTDQDAFLSALR